MTKCPHCTEPIGGPEEVEDPSSALCPHCGKGIAYCLKCFEAMPQSTPTGVCSTCRDLIDKCPYCQNTLTLATWEEGQRCPFCSLPFSICPGCDKPVKQEHYDKEGACHRCVHELKLAEDRPEPPMRLWDETYYHYAAKCRHCDAHNRWPTPKTGRSYGDFCRTVLSRGYAYSFIKQCPSCGNQTVHDLTGLSSEEKP